jgi:hypothetical protein
MLLSGGSRTDAALPVTAPGVGVLGIVRVPVGTMGLLGVRGVSGAPVTVGVTLHPLPVGTAPALAAPTPAAPEVGIFGVVRVPLRTVRDLSQWVLRQRRVLTMRQNLQMSGVATGAVTADVVNLQVPRNEAHNQFPHEPVGRKRSTEAGAAPPAVARHAPVGDPFPALPKVTAPRDVPSEVPQLVVREPVDGLDHVRSHRRLPLILLDGRRAVSCLAGGI